MIFQGVCSEDYLARQSCDFLCVNDSHYPHFRHISFNIFIFRHYLDYNFHKQLAVVATQAAVKWTQNGILTLSNYTWSPYSSKSNQSCSLLLISLLGLDSSATSCSQALIHCLLYYHKTPTNPSAKSELGSQTTRPTHRLIGGTVGK